MRNLLETSRASQINLIERVCAELGAPERAEELVGKYIDDSIRIKKFKDKNAPKKPKSGYMLYCEKHRVEVKKSLPEGAAFADIIKEMAKNWNAIDEEGKKEYVNLAEDDKKRYARELDEYKAELYKTNVGASS
jgi:Icc-related predicted phosphoesterase